MMALEQIKKNIALPEAELEAFCHRWKITELALFGSALRPDFGPQSDVDLLVTFAPNTSWSMLDLAQMEQEAEQLLNRPVDLVSRKAIERSQNWIRRKAILESAQVIYAACNALPL